jgi:MFS family permease
LVAYLIVIKIKEEWKVSEREAFDIKGALLLGLGISFIIIGMTYLKALWYGKYLLFCGLVVIGLFIYTEKTQTSPIVDMEIFKKNKLLGYSLLATMINYSSGFAVGYLLSLYLQYEKGLSPEKTGLILVVQPIIQMIFSPIAGRLSDKIRPKILASIGMGICATGIMVFIFIEKNTSLYWILLGLGILGFGFAVFSSPNTNAIMNIVIKKYYGVTSGILSACRLMGQTISITITTLVISIYSSNSELSIVNHDYLVDALKAVFIIYVVLCTIGVFLSFSENKENTLQYD